MHRATASVAMSSAVPTGAVAGIGARRLPTPRDAPAGRRSVLVRSGKRAGRGSKFSRESLIVTSESTRPTFGWLSDQSPRQRMVHPS